DCVVNWRPLSIDEFAADPGPMFQANGDVQRFCVRLGFNPLDRMRVVTSATGATAVKFLSAGFLQYKVILRGMNEQTAGAREDHHLETALGVCGMNVLPAGDNSIRPGILR